MAGALPQLPKATGRAYKALAEMVGPDTVHHDPRGKRISWICDRFGKLQSPAALREGRRRRVAKDRQKSARRFLAQVLRISTNMNLEVLRLLHVFDDVQERILRGEFSLFALQLFGKLGCVALPLSLQKAVDCIAFVLQDPFALVGGKAGSRVAEELGPENVLVPRVGEQDDFR